MKRYIPLQERNYKFINSIKKKYSIKEKILKEEVTSHKDSIMNLADQITKYLGKNKDHPNSFVNDMAIGIFLGVSEYFSKDGDSSTRGINYISKIIDKMKVLAKTYSDLVPNDENDFQLDDVDVEGLENELSDEESNEDFIDKNGSSEEDNSFENEENDNNEDEDEDEDSIEFETNEDNEDENEE